MRTSRFRLIPPRPRRLIEAQVSRQVCDFLRYRGWWVMRTQGGLFRGRWGNSQDPGKLVRIGQLGQSDFVALRSRGWRRIAAEALKEPICDVFFLEIKAAGKEPNPYQSLWLMLREREGFFVTWTDDLVRFQGWYRERFGEV